MQRLIPALAITVFALVSVSCSSTHKSPPAAPAVTSPAPTLAPFTLNGSEWLLADLAGTAVVPDSKASLSFIDPGRVAGNASCNRFTGTATISGNNLKFGSLATTMMACADPNVSAQETTYLKALAAASRYEWHNPYLFIFCDGFDKPLQFIRAPSPAP